MPATSFDTPIGCCAIAWEADQIIGFSLPPAANSEDPYPSWMDAIIVRVRRHLEGEMQDFAGLPYAWNRVSAFRCAVYEAALRVKPGQTWSYGQLAAAVGQPAAAARAVGTALAQNPWPLLVPCHRFIGADGRMTGFSCARGDQDEAAPPRARRRRVVRRMTPPLLVDGKVAARKLAASDPVLAGVIERVGPCPLAPVPEVDLFQALLRSIIYQQLHGKAAAAIHAPCRRDDARRKRRRLGGLA